MRKCANLVEIKNASKRILVFTIYSQKSSSKQPRTNPAKLGNYKKTIALANFAIQFKASPAASDAERRPGTLLWRPNPRAALGGWSPPRRALEAKWLPPPICNLPVDIGQDKIPITRK